MSLKQNFLLKSTRIWRVVIMRHICIAVLAAVMTPGVNAAQQFIAFKPAEGYQRIDLANAGILVDNKEDKAVHHAVDNLKEDIARATSPGIPKVGEKVSIVIGTANSPLIRKYIRQGVINGNDLKGKWEKYVIAACDTDIVIAGSDRRGCVYGIYELSRQLGVSPWYWWADIPVVRHDDIYIKKGVYTDGEPKVKYRGIFINDENPCMQKWARMKFGGMNSKMYARVYELLLRMKCNLLWPGMWGSFKEYKPLVPILKNEDGTYEGNCFNWDDPLNPKLADEMGIVVGTSHHEPMQRSQQEWIRTKANYGNGEWNYMTNGEALRRFFREGIENTKDYECMITVGMRGDEDRPMADAGGREANMRLLKRIFDDQRQIINGVMGKRAKDMPLVWTLYSEMLDYYDEGFQVPDDVTIMLCDDNWGDIRKIPTPDTRHRKGGFGMYYHFSYYGAPRAMKWLQQMQIQHVWHQMDIAYRSGIDRVWIVNVGDIKPAEFPTQFFMDMAWNPDRFNPDNLMEYTRDFCSQFAAGHAGEAAEVLNSYCKYAARITAEMLDENTYRTDNGEWKRVRDEFMVLETEALRIYLMLNEDCRDAYKQIILFPVQAMANLHDLYYSVAMNRHLASIDDMEANHWADRAEKCFERDSLLCRDYNKVMTGGKWDGMMDEVHIGYKTWHAPQYNIMPQVVRFDSTSARHGGFINEMQCGTAYIDARRYYSAATPEGSSWTVIPHLGKTSSALTLMPSLASTDGAALTYRIKTAQTVDSMRVKVVFSTVMPFIKGGHDVELGFTGCSAKTINLNKDMNWQHCYDLMYPAGAARVIEIETVLPAMKAAGGCYELNLRPLVPGIVIQGIFAQVIPPL